MWKFGFIIFAFLAGLYAFLIYRTTLFSESFQPSCPDVLVQRGSELWLKNSKLAEIPGVNPVVFHNLEEYTRFVEWQQAQNIDCPVLFLQQSFDAQNESVYAVKPAPELIIDKAAGKLIDATRGNPPYNQNTYPAMDTHNQLLGQKTVLDVYGEVGETQNQSADPMDPNWGGAEYSMAAVNAGNYEGNEIYIHHDIPQKHAGPIHGLGERDLRQKSNPEDNAEFRYLQSAGNYN